MKKYTYVVELAKPSRQVFVVYGRAYFPRKFHYQAEALRCQHSVAELKGEAVVRKIV